MATKEYEALSPKDKATLALAREIRFKLKADSNHIHHSKRCISPTFSLSARSIPDEIVREFWPWRLWQYPGPTKLLGSLLLGGGLTMTSVARIRGGREKISIERCLVASNWCRVTSAKLLAWAERLDDYAQARVDGLAAKGRYPSGGRMPGSPSPHDFKKRRP